MSNVPPFTPPPAMHPPINQDDPDGLPGWFNPAAPLVELDKHLAVLRDFKNKQINKWREDANYTFFYFLGHRIACDRLSRSDIDAANGEIIGSFAFTGSTAMPVGWVGGWKSMDNVYVPIPDIHQWRAFYSAMFNTGIKNFAKSQYLKYLVSNSSDLKFVMDLNWSLETPYDITP